MIMSRPQAGGVPPAPRQKEGKTCPGSHKEWRPEAGPAAPCPPGSPTARIPSTFQAGSWEAEAGEEAASCPGASGRAEREGRHHPHPRRGHTWALQAGRGARAGAWLQRVWAASSRRPGGGRQMGRPPARPATQAGNSRQGCQEGGREWRGGAEVAPAPEGRGQAQARPRPCEPWNAGSAACLSGFPWASHFSFLSPSFPTSKMRLLIPALFLSLCDLRSVSFPSVPWFSYPENGATAMGHLQ